MKPKYRPVVTSGGKKRAEITAMYMETSKPLLMSYF